MFDLDLLATFRGVEAAMPYLEKSKAGSIVAVSSTAALEDFFGPQAYNAVKAAVINYASALLHAATGSGPRMHPREHRLPRPGVHHRRLSGTTIKYPHDPAL